MKKLFLVFSLLLVNYTFSGDLVYGEGNELESKKRTSPAVLYQYKSDLIRLLDTRVFLFDQLNYGRSAAHVKHTYKIEKGDKIKLLESLRNGEIFKVQLLKKGPEGSHPYFIESKSLKHFSLIESQTSTLK